MRTVYYALVPLFILLFFAAISSIVSYIILMLAGDIISMRKIVSKAAQVFLLLSIFPLRHYLKLSWSDIGFAAKPVFFKQLAYGLLLGLLTLMPVMIVLYALDISVIDQSRVWTTFLQGEIHRIKKPNATQITVITCAISIIPRIHQGIIQIYLYTVAETEP